MPPLPHRSEGRGRPERVRGAGPGSSAGAVRYSGGPSPCRRREQEQPRSREPRRPEVPVGPGLKSGVRAGSGRLWGAEGEGRIQRRFRASPVAGAWVSRAERDECV